VLGSLRREQALQRQAADAELKRLTEAREAELRELDARVRQSIAAKDQVSEAREKAGHGKAWE
jgi:hypothetical protein